jgi:hypothetical protein
MTDTLDSDRIERLDLQLANFVKDNMRYDGNPDGADPEEIMIALGHAMAVVLATVCPVCRKRLVREFKADLPALLVHASRLAAEAKAEVPSSSACH